MFYADTIISTLQKMIVNSIWKYPDNNIVPNLFCDYIQFKFIKTRLTELCSETIYRRVQIN